MRKIDLSNQVFNKLYVIGPDSEDVKKWVCRCLYCGNIKSISGSHLKSGDTKSCGCLRKLSCVLIRTTHNLSKTPIYNLWNHIRNRCYNKNDKAYHNYGGRGIKVCTEWLNDIECFYNYIKELDNYEKSGYSLDRINNNGDYEPGNVKWSTNTEQCRNRRTTKLNKLIVENILLDSHIMNVSELARKYKVSRKMIYKILKGISWIENE